MMYLFKNVLQSIVLENEDDYLDNEKHFNKRKYNERCASVINFWLKCDCQPDKNIKAVRFTDIDN